MRLTTSPYLFLSLYGFSSPLDNITACDGTETTGIPIQSNGTLWIRAGARAVGSFIGKRVRLGIGVELTLQGGPF